MPHPIRLSEGCNREAPTREDRLTLDITERFLRDFIKVQLPRLVRSRTQALLVEEMEVCLGRARVDLAVIAKSPTKT